MKKARKILVIRYRFLGDTILTVPFLRNLRRQYDDATIDVLVGPQSGKVLENCPYINDLIVYDTTRFHKYDQGEGEAKSFWSYALELRRRRYNSVFVLKRSVTAVLLAFLTGAKERIGYGSGLKSLFLTQSVPWHSNKHEVESTLDVLRAANIPPKDNYLEAWTTKEEIATARAHLPENADRFSKFVLIHAAAAHPDKMYPSQKWSHIVARLYHEYGFTTVFSGSKDDFHLNQEIIQASGVTCHNLAGQLSIRESMALYKLMQLAICVDSGPSHLAVSVGTPTLVIFGPTDPARWRPFADNSLAIYDSSLLCRPCNYKKICNDKRECLTELDPDSVVQAAIRLYEKAAISI